MNQDTTHNNTNQHNESTLAKIPQLGQISANLKRPTQVSKIRKGKSVNVQLTLSEEKGSASTPGIQLPLHATS